MARRRPKLANGWGRYTGPMRDALRQVGGRVRDALDRAGVIDAARLTETMDLAWPRIVTGFAIMSKQTVDLAFVGWAVGSAAVAGLAFAYAYWMLAKFLAIGLAGGTVSLVSQNYGGDATDRAATVVAQSVWVALALVVPIVLAFVFLSEPLVALFDGDPVPTQAGATYLAIVAPGLVFEFLNLIASRTYAGVGDTFTPMVARAGGGLFNILLSGALVLAGFGVAGVAVGTAVSTGLVLVVLAWGMTGRSYGRLGMRPSPVVLTDATDVMDRELAGQLARVSAPLMARRVLEMLVVFPLLWIAATFGPVVVGAFEVGRRIRDLINSVSWGFSIAASTLVGQALGAGDETEARAIGWAIIRLSVVVYVLVAAVVVLVPDPLARLFVADPAEVAQAAVFIQVGAVSAVLRGIDGSATGALRGAGDTTWPFAASVTGRYLFALPVAVIGYLTPLGVAGLYLALVLEAVVPGISNLWRFSGERWRAISRDYRPS
jgi:putative MATE family efflux protein